MVQPFIYSFLHSTNIYQAPICCQGPICYETIFPMSLVCVLLGLAFVLFFHFSAFPLNLLHWTLTHAPKSQLSQQSTPCSPESVYDDTTALCLAEWSSVSLPAVKSSASAEMNREGSLPSVLRAEEGNWEGALYKALEGKKKKNPIWFVLKKKKKTRKKKKNFLRNKKLLK